MSGLPRLLLLADEFAGADGEAVQQNTLAAVRAGVRWVQLRNHEIPPEAFATQSFRFVAALRAVGEDLAISINTYIDLARELDTGLHVGGRGPSAADARARLPGSVLSVAVHTTAEAERAAEAQAEAVLFSPVFPTTSKPGHPGAGLDALAACCHAVRLPVFALGGIVPDRVASCREVGAYGVAVRSGILDADDPAEATAHYLAALAASP